MVELDDATQQEAALEKRLANCQMVVLTPSHTFKPQVGGV